MKSLWRWMFISMTVWSFGLSPGAVSAANCTDMDACMAEALKTAADDTTIGELRERCTACLAASGEKNASPADAVLMSTASEPGVESGIANGLSESPQPSPPEPSPPQLSPIDERLAAEAENRKDAFALTPHRPNYILPIVYNHSPNVDVFDERRQDELQNTEIKFQISIKYKLFDDIFKENGDLYVAYTNLSYWQAYNRDDSSPFRDINHEPEAWLQFDFDRELFWGIKSKVVQGGIWHQSNGREEPLSRSWNRLYLNFIFEKDNFVFAVKPWYRIPEDDDNDNNPDIERYMGYGELRAAYKWHEHTFSTMLRNNLRGSGNKGAIELGWSFPLYKKLKGYVQYFNGYGQSILDYDDSANTIGVGLALSDIL